MPLGGSHRVLHGTRVLLTGDAASLAEPLTGEGIYYAVKSAKIAAETVLQALESSLGDLSSYTVQVNAEITRDLKYARLLAGLFYHLPRLCFHFLVRSPRVQRGVADVLCGRASFESLQYQLLKHSPHILLAGLRTLDTGAASTLGRTPASTGAEESRS